MSRAKDRARAQSGTIFRDGRLWSREEWYAQHPTREVQAAKQEQVDEAVAAMLEKKFEDKPYLCSKCNRTHKPGSKVYQEHRKHMTVINPNHALISIPLEQGVA